MRNLAVQHIAAGRGVGVIDPHGDLAEELLDHVPASRVGDVAYVNPADTAHLMAFNILESTGPGQRHQVASSVVEAFKNIGADKARLLGALLVARLQVAAMSRADQPENERRDFFLHVDEFHNFTTQSFAALSEARKYGLGLTLAHQYTDQLDAAIRDAVFGNVGTLVVFRVGTRDAKRLATELGTEIPAHGPTDLAKYEAFVKRPAGAFADPPAKAQMLPPIGNFAGRREQIIRHSRDRFGRQRSVVEDKIERFMQV